MLNATQKEILEQVGVGSVEELMNLIEGLEDDSEEKEYFSKVLEQVQELK
ncbi:MAG: hypothetical protein WBL19_00935 [Minisyncoccia bacterium]